MAASLPTMVSKYELVQKIGAGGMGEVFFGYRHGEYGVRRPVAIKRVRRDRMDEPEALGRFIREAQLGAQLEHPNLVAVQDFHLTQEGDLLLVMDYIRGWSLSELLRRQQSARLPIAAAVYVIKEVLRGLAFAHKRGIVHRDIKPENILIAHQTGAVMVADLGLAHLLSQSRQERGTNPCGTVPYVAPEQLRGAGIDARADLFSVGMMFYQLLTGKLPFRRTDKIEHALMQVLFASIQSPTSVNLEVPPELDCLVMLLLEREANDRYDSAERVLEVLQELEELPEVRGGKEVLMKILAALQLGPDGAHAASAQRLTVVAAPKQPAEPPLPAPRSGGDIDEGYLSASSCQRPSRLGRHLLAAACCLGLAGLGWSAAQVLISRPIVVVQQSAQEPRVPANIAPPDTAPAQPAFAPDYTHRVTHKRVWARD